MNKSAHDVVIRRSLVAGFAVVAIAAASSRGSFEPFDFAGATVAAVTPTRDAFRTAIGGGTVAGAITGRSPSAARSTGTGSRTHSLIRMRFPPTSSM